MFYETSYDTSLKPFNHDKNRGRWSSPMDFFFACIIHGFKIDAILVMPSLVFGDLGIYCLIPYLIVLAVCVVPIVFLQSFLGQFSSTGFISVFRISPLFKGIGYVSLAINLTTLTYYSIFGAIPLFFLFHSLRPTIPWSCEGAKEWMDISNGTLTPCSNILTQEMLLVNNISHWSCEGAKEWMDISNGTLTPCSNILTQEMLLVNNISHWSCEGAKEWMDISNGTLTPCSNILTQEMLLVINISHEMKIPSYEFFRNHIQPMDLHKRDHPDGIFSWSLLICTFILWAIVGTILTKPIETISRFIRYSCLTVIGILCLLLFRLAFLPGAFAGIREIFAPPGLSFSYIDVWAVMPIMALAALGPGWGSILTMASYNSFKTNIFKYSWLLCLAQFGILFGLAIQEIFVRNYLLRPDPNMMHHQYMHSQWMEFLVAPSTLTFLELPHLWSIVFFGMMILGTLNLLIVQLFSVLTSLFDEYEKLRERRKEVTVVMATCLCVASIGFCSNYGITFAELLAKFSGISQMALNLFLLLVVLWIYGRERFQRDINFMTGRTYPTWMVNIVRFVAPAILLISWIGGAGLSLSLGYHTVLLVTCVLSIVLLPWLFVPGYGIYKILQTSGALGVRFRRAIRPTDWYPVDSIYRDQYEETFSQPEISHQLTTTTAAE